MSKKVLFFLYLLIHNTITPTIINGITLPESRIQNLVICNDSSEFYINEKEFPLPWTIESKAISLNLLYALSAQQLVISTKSLWRNVQFLAQVWLDFATLSSQELTIKYQQLSKLPATEFARHLNRYQPCIKEIHALYQIINNVITAHHAKPLPEISHQINIAMKSAWDKHPEWLQKSKLRTDLQDLFTIFTLYQLTLSNNYICKDMSTFFILFIPQILTHAPHLDHNLHTITTQPNTSNADIFMGLRYTDYANYDYLNPISIIQAQTLANTLKGFQRIGNIILTGSKELGTELYNLFNEMFIKKSSLKKPFQDHFAEILPIFNIFIGGHGSLDYITANISMTIVTKTKYMPIKTKNGKQEMKTITYQSSDLLDIIKLLNTQIFMKSLIVSSCYQSGKKIKDEFNITSKLHNPILEEITYPIILLGSTLAPTTATFWPAILPPFHHPDISNSIYPKQKLYGPIKINGQEAFIRFFNFLNDNKVYEKYETIEKGKKVQHYRLQNPDKELPSLETFSHAKPSYLHAANVFANMYNENEQTVQNEQTAKMKPQYFANYILIKFPHTSWFTPARFNKVVMKLSQIISLTKAQIIVPQGTQAILMDANYIPTHIFIQQQNFIPFIPINYFNQNYIFDAITVTQNMPLNQFLKQFFTIENIGEPINIVIKELTLGNQKLSNVYIFMHNDFGIKGVRNGYIITNATGNTSMTHWDNNKSFGFEQQEEPYSITDNAKLIASINKNATKKFSAATKEITTKSGKKYEIETSGLASKETIQKLQAQLETNKGSSNAKDMFNKSRKQQEDEQQQTKSAQKRGILMNALELANLIALS